MSNNIEHAETIALKAIHFILADDDLQQSFLDISGIFPDQLKNEINNPEFLGGVLDFLLGNEEQLVSFCEEHGINPMEPAKVRSLFPGGSMEF